MGCSNQNVAASGTAALSNTENRTRDAEGGGAVIETKWTPLMSWEVDQIPIVLGASSRDPCVAIVWRLPGESWDAHRDRAAKIAQAPAMAEALEDILTHLQVAVDEVESLSGPQLAVRHSIDKARACLAAAKGDA